MERVEVPSGGPATNGRRADLVQQRAGGGGAMRARRRHEGRAARPRHPGPWHGPLRATRPAGRLAAALTLGAVLALTGCATPDGPGGATTPSGTPPEPDSPVTDDDAPDDGATPAPTPSEGPRALAAELTVTLDETGEGETRTWSLTCEPTGGDHPDADAACEALARGGVAAFEPTPRDVACTEQWGGPQRATVVGTVDGTRVDAEFSRINGCEISRWETLAPLLGSAGGLL